MQWLEELGVSSPATEQLKRRLQSPNEVKHPPVAIAQANFASLRDVLHMGDEQARFHRLVVKEENHLHTVLVTADAAQPQPV